MKITNEKLKRMTGEEYREKISALGMSQVAAAEFLDIAVRTSARYALGASPIPGAVAILLRTMVRKKLNPDDLRGKAVDDPEDEDRLLEQAYIALDRCFRQLCIDPDDDDEDVTKLLPPERFNDLLVAWQEWREKQEDADGEDVFEISK
jgi:hypothetical protein